MDYQNAKLRLVSIITLLLLFTASKISATDISYSIVWSSGHVAISKVVTDPSGTLTVPADIMSPYMPNQNSYKFFNSKAEAAAYTTSQTTTGEITDANSITGSTVYIGYHYDSSTRPSDLPKLDGSAYYQIAISNGNSDFDYLYSRKKEKDKATNDNIYYGDENATDNYSLWLFKGNDPYNLQITNKGVGEGTKVCAHKNAWDAGFLLNQFPYTNFVMLYDKIKNVNSGYYTIAYVWDQDNPTNTDTNTQYNPGNVYYLSFVYRGNGYKTESNSISGNNVGQIKIGWNDGKYDGGSPTGYSSNRTNGHSLSFKEISDGKFRFVLHKKVSGGTIEVDINTDNSSTTNQITLPKELVRRYANSDGKFYATYNPETKEFSNPYTNYKDMWDYGTHNTPEDIGGNDDYVTIHVDYDVNLPFTTSTDYDNATWYQWSYPKNNGTIYHSLNANQTIGSSTTASFDVAYQFAFTGDPYEMKIWSRAAGDASKYVGVPANSTGENALLVGANDISTWELVSTSETTDNDQFVLRQYGKYTDIEVTAERNKSFYLGHPGGGGSLYYGNTAYTINKLTPLPGHAYTYHIIDRQGREAIKYTLQENAKQSPGLALDYNTIPSDIRSPYITDETLSFYTTATQNGTAADGRTRYTLSDRITETPDTEGAHIYVTYTTNKISEKLINLTNSRTFNLQVNGSAIYSDNTNINVNSSADDNSLSTQDYMWHFEGNDPYAVQLTNVKTNKHVTHAPDMSSNNALTLSSDEASTSFILMKYADSSSESEKQIELMAATATDLATKSYYSIGLSDGATKMLGSTTYSHDNAAIQIIATKRTFHAVYHLIDLSGKELLSEEADGDGLGISDKWKSPLVSAYHYYNAENITKDGDNYTVEEGATELTDVTQITGSDIYVTYTVNPNDEILTTIDISSEDATRTSTLAKRDKDKFKAAGKGNTRIFNMRFHNGTQFRQENNQDGFKDNATQAVYPYTCGDACMYIYGEDEWERQLSQGASTRTRWPWFIVSATGDPYHVKITSYKESHIQKTEPIKEDGVDKNGEKNYYSYFRTYYEPNYYGSGSGKIITANVSDDPRVWDTEKNLKDANEKVYANAQAVATEYMLLGTTGNYKLLTVNPVDDGDGNTANDERQYVHSFEQYWKTWDTVRRWNDDTKTFDSWVANKVTSALTDYHAYQTWAFARPDQLEQGAKRYAYETHYFQTIEMGEEFDLEPVTFAPVLVLLDNHGWEVVRHPIPVSSDSESEKEAKNIFFNSYNSPAVKEYRWFTSAKKMDGYHKYKEVSEPGIKIYKKDNNKWVEDTNKEKYVHKSTSLNDFPYDHLNTAQGYENDYPEDNMTDLYVTYTVKDEYAKAYDGDKNISAPFLFKQGDKYATTDGTTISTVEASTITSDGKTITAGTESINNNILWYLKRNRRIDYEMGYLYKGEANAEKDAETERETENDYTNKTDSLQHNGFDPYNLQIEAVTGGKYLTTTATDAVLYLDGTVRANNAYTTASMQAHVESGEAFTFLNHGNKTAHITNQTFMLIKDVNGNSRLFPRFDHLRAVQNFTEMGLWDSSNPGRVTEFIPVGHYTVKVYDADATTPTVKAEKEVWAIPSSPIGESPTEDIPLPNSLVRAGCYYTGAFTTYDSNNNTYSDQTDIYPILTAEELTAAGGKTIYVPYKIDGTGNSIWFASSEDDAVQNNKWNFLMIGTEGRAAMYSAEGLGEADKSYVKNGSWGFRFLERKASLTDPDGDGKQDLGNDEVDDPIGHNMYDHVIASTNTKTQVYLMSPTNDFRRIAETYVTGKNVEFREGQWLWGFIGNPYDGFYIINKEVKDKGKDKRVTAIGGNEIKLSKTYEGDERCSMWEIANLKGKGNNANGSDMDGSFALKPKEGSYTNRHIYKYGNNDLTLNEIDNSNMPQEASMFAYPWNWSDTKYKTVTVNIFQDNMEHDPVLSKTYTPADRMFMAGDVIDGTSGHFYLPHEIQEDHTWAEKSGDGYYNNKPQGIINSYLPYDHHLVNIPSELRRQFCEYTVDGGSFTVEETNDEQIVNIIYKLNDKAPLFVSEDELEQFSSLKLADTFKDGKTKRDYVYFLDGNTSLGQKLYVNDDTGFTSGNRTRNTSSRYSVTRPTRPMWVFVGNPYNVRLINLYAQEKYSPTTPRNLVRNKLPNNRYGAFGTTADNWNISYMEDINNNATDETAVGKVYWEMVEPSQATSASYLDTNHANVSYRKDLLSGKQFALRIKDGSWNNATYFYLKDNGNTQGSSCYNASSDNTNPRGNEQERYLNFPDTRHAANDATTMFTYLSPAKIYVSVYDQDEPTRLVTENELSEFCAVGERFKGVPENLQRNYCDYTWASTNSDPKSANMLDGEGYFIPTKAELSMYAKYEENASSPFSKLDGNGKPILKKTGTWDSPWFNMKINNRWAYFNSKLNGLTEAVNGKPETAGTPNVTEVTFPYSGDMYKVNADESVTEIADRFHKGMHWALIGDPYNFQLRNQRDIVTLDDDNKPSTATGDYEYTPAYLSGTVIKPEAEATMWTWIRKAGSNDYFLSNSATRRTELSTSPRFTPSPNGLRRLPAGYSITAAEKTENFEAPNAGSGILTGNIADNYAVGNPMVLQSVAAANNESFDAVVNVYNKMNELVATTGWTELARNNAEWNGSLPVDVRRWGCTYHYWADETMTKYPFTNYSQKDASGNYLIQDGGIIYVNYDYDESLYSSENEYRWMNIFLNWDEQHTKSELKSGEKKLYTEEVWGYNTPEGEDPFFSKIQSREVSGSTDKYGYTVQWYETTDTYAKTEEGWIESPKEDNGNMLKEKAYAYYRDGHYSGESTNEKGQKWALIGDPYKFILYNYNRKTDADGQNAYYLYYDTESNQIVNKNFTGDDKFTDETDKHNKQGIYWTWKVDGNSFKFKKPNDGNTATDEYKRSGLPESFYRYAKEAGREMEIETGYLAACDMKARGVYSTEDYKTLIGSVLGYVSYNSRPKLETQNTNNKATYYEGNPEKWKQATYTNAQSQEVTYDYTTFSHLVGEATQKAALTLWQTKYGSGSSSGSSTVSHQDVDGNTRDYYIGPSKEQGAVDDPYQKAVTTYEKQDVYNPVTVANDQQFLALTGSASESATILNTNGAERFLVMPSSAHAASVTFHLDTSEHGDSKRTFETNPIPDFTTNNFGVNNTVMLPWMMRREYCDYQYYLIEAADNDPAASDKVDNLKYDKDADSDARNHPERSDDYSNG